MAARSKQGSALPVILILAALVLVLAGLTLAVLDRRARILYGPPGEFISLPDRARYALMLYNGRSQMESAPARPELERKFSINPGDSLGAICQKLEADSYVLSGDLTCAYLAYSGKDRFIQSGTFTLETGLTPKAIADRLADATARDIPLLIFAGWRAEEIAFQVNQNGFVFSGDEFLAFVDEPPAYVLDLLGLPAGSGLEGFLFPGTYSFKPTITLEQAMAFVLTGFVDFAQDNALEAGYARQGLSLAEGITLASIIQRETNDNQEMPIIASVLYNRLASGMRLETDPTVQYALGYYEPDETWWKSGLTLEDLQVNSPYNTYVVNGLPPAPISNPGPEALKAAASPASSDFLFFRAKCDGSGSHNFSITYEEHLKNGCD